jgi:hypothetical protein
VNPKVVSEMLGHASVSITLDIYSHVLPDMQQDAAATIAGLLYGNRRGLGERARKQHEPFVVSFVVKWHVQTRKPDSP